MQSHVVRRAICHDFPPRVTAFRAEVNQPITGPNHIQVVLDHDQRMTGIQ